MSFHFHPGALEEYRHTTLYYSDISREIGLAFVDEIELGIQHILEYPRAWPVVEQDVRRHLITRFPYGIYYTVENDYILIIAVMHMSRKPGYWKDRLKDA